MGNSRKCDKTKTAKEREDYCVLAYKEFEDIQDCTDAENFCYACCDHEFGILKLN